MAATWWTKPDGTRVLVLPVHSSLEDGPPEDFECYAVEMDMALAQGLLKRIEQLRSWKAQDDDLSCAQFWDYTGEYYGRNWSAGAPQEDDEGNPPPQWVRGEYDGRTDGDRLEVGDDWIEWRAYVKNTDIRLHTDSLDEKDLRRYVAGEDPWPTAPAREVSA